MYFHGSGGMLKCQGMSKEEAQENQQLREAIASDERVKSTFGTFTLENGCGKVTLDAMKAYEHVRYVLNDMRRAGKCETTENADGSRYGYLARSLRSVTIDNNPFLTGQ